MIFFVSTAAVVLSFISLMFVRLQDQTEGKHGYATVPMEDEEEAQVGTA
jgi:hypothetical protein